MKLGIFLKHYGSSKPIRLLVATTICVFVAEALIMILLSALPLLSTWVTVFLDATLIVTCVLPVLYFSFFRPLQRSLLKQAKSEKLLKTSENKFRNYIDSSPYTLIVVDKNGSILDVNDAATKISGYSREELLSMDLIDFFPPDETKFGVEHFSKVVESGKSSGVIPIIIKSGDRRQWEIEATRLGENRFLGFISDVTGRMKAEEALSVSKERFRTQMIQSPMVMEIYALDGLQIEVNRAYEKLWGFPASTTVNKFNVLKSKEVEDTGLMEYVKRGYAGETVTIPEYIFDPTGETESGGPGRVRWLSTKIYPLKDSSGNVVNIVITHEDITNRKNAEEARRESEERHRRLFEQSNDAIFVHSLEGKILDVNNRACDLTSYDRAELLAMSLAKLHPEDELKNAAKAIETTQKDGSVIFESKFITAGGDILNVNISSRLIDKDAGLVQGIVRDVTDRKRAEDAQRKSEDKFRKYITNAPYGIFIVDAQGHYVDVNEAACKMTGYTKSELLNMSIPDLVDPKSTKDGPSNLDKVKKSGRASTEVALLHKDGTSIWTSLDAVALSEDRFMAFCSDITETKRLQELESRAERLETAGTIAGQVAHDFNNLLAPIMAYPDLIHDELPHDNEAHGYLDAIENAAKKIADINQDLLTMGRRGHYSQDILDLNRVVLQATQEMKSRTETVTIETKLYRDLLKIKGGSAQIHRMLTNLLVNAQDAMGDIGQITINTENYYADDTSIAFGRVPKGEYVKLTVSDNGCGIPDEIIQKILDPFFTTKTADKRRGSGLGLSVVDAVMRDHNGYLDLTSKIGQGTSFYLYFPVTREETQEVASEHLTTGAEKVLIVDDDEVQRKVTMRLLNKLGYKVSSVESGEKAVEFIKENRQDLVILDMVMPGGIDGTETYRQFLDINPHQKAIILSGFSGSDRIFEAQKLGAGAFVKKPVTRITIATAVRTELDRMIEVSNF